MASHYSIVQYIADAAKDERVNIGIVTFGDGRMIRLFTDNWSRIKHFTRTDIDWLRDVVRDARHWDEEFVRDLAAHPRGSVHVTEPSASVLSPEDLAFFVGQRLLTEDPVNQRGYQRKSDVVRVVKSRVREKLRNRFGVAGSALVREHDYPFAGRRMQHQFDVAVGNGRPIFAAQALSFQIPETRKLDKEVSAAAWIVQDVKQAFPDFPIGVIVSPPRQANARFNDAVAAFQYLNAEVVQEGALDAWADRMADLVPPPGGPYLRQA
ncbi:MAG: DUF3037 domain-containing protein [Planctomycetaceae bacterium]|nr:DUF3037 domain-containing protein [Planctomycetaceae bacterium]